MINDSSTLKGLFLNLEGNNISGKKDEVYTKIRTLLDSYGKEEVSQALEGVNVIDALIRDMSSESNSDVVHSLSVFSNALEAKPEIVKCPESILHGLVNILQNNISQPKASDIIIKAFQCVCLICPSLKSLGKETSAIDSILLKCLSNGGNDSAGIAVRFQALRLLESLLQFKLLECSDCNNWIKVVINSVFDENTGIRDAAVKAAGIFKLQLTGTEEYLDVLANNLVPSKYSRMLVDMILTDKNWAVIWRLLVEMLGKRLHTSSALVNSLLAVEEKAFKTSNVETKKEAFNCWNSLVINFALEQSVLSSDRRVKLLTIPLRANNCRNGEVALVKMNVWWNIIKLMKSDVTNFSDMVLTPFLSFCYGSISESSHLTSNGGARLSNSNGGEACAKLYTVLRVPSLHAFCEILSKSAGVTLPDEAAKGLAVEPLVEQPIVSRKVFCSLSRLLTQCLGEAIISEGNDFRQMPYIINSWHSLLVLISQGSDEPLYTGDSVSKDVKNVAMVKEILRLLATLVDFDASLSEGKVTTVILSMIESMVDGEFAFPSSVLNSHSYGVGNAIIMNSSPSLYLSVLLLAPAFALDKRLRSRIKEVFSKILHVGCSSILSPLPFARAILKKMEKDTNDQSLPIIMPYFQELWVLIANHLSEIIDKEGSVSEGNGAGHDFRCIYGMLMLPISYALKMDQSQESLEPALKSWARLFELFAVNAQLVVTAQPNEVVEDLGRKILNIFKKSSLTWACLANGIQYLLVMYQKPCFDVLWKGMNKKNSTKEEKLIWNHNPQQLLLLVASKILAHFPKISENVNIDEKHNVVMQYFSLMFSSASSQNLLNSILEKGLQGAGYYLKLTAVSHTHNLRNEVVTLWEKFLNFLEKLLPVSTFKIQAVVDSLSPIFLEAFNHPLAQIVEHTKIYWNRSLGQYFSTAVIPKYLSDVLDDALKDTGSSEDALGDMVAVEAQKNIFVAPDGKRGKPKAKMVLPQKAKTSQPSDCPESSEEFKVILPKPKTALLTDHQREMMKERRVDIPALYQDLTQDSMSQCFSQENQTEPASKPAASILMEEDANPPFTKVIESDANPDTVNNMTKHDKMVDLKPPSTEKSVLSNRTSKGSPARIGLDLETKICDQTSSSSNTNDTSNDILPAKRRGRRKKKFDELKNVDSSGTATESSKVLKIAAERSEGIVPTVGLELDKTVVIAEVDAKLLPEKQSGDGDVVSDQTKQKCNSGNVVVPNLSLSVCSSNAASEETSTDQGSLPKDSIPGCPISDPNILRKKESSVMNSTVTNSEKLSLDTAGPAGSNNDQKLITSAVNNGVLGKEGEISSLHIVVTPQASKSVGESSGVTGDGADCAESCKTGLANVKISSPRKITDVEFSKFQKNKFETSGTSRTKVDASVEMGSPKSKELTSSPKSRIFPFTSPKSKSTGSSPKLDNWIIVTRRENGEKSSAKSPEKQSSQDGGSKNIPVIILDSDSDDISDVDENLGAHEICVFSKSEDIVDSSQNPLEAPTVQLKGPMRKCSVNLPRVSDILPEEVAFIQYEGRTVKCHMSPKKDENKAEEESRKVVSSSSPVVNSIFSPLTSHSRGARMLTMAQGNKEKSGEDENPESPMRGAVKVVLQNSDSNVQHSPLSHLKSYELNNSTPPAKKPRRIRPIHLGSLSPQYQSSEGCGAPESEVPSHTYSPHASARGSLIKRKKSPGEDSISPLSKKIRRVSFADPIVSQKVEFALPPSEVLYKKSGVNRCLKLPDKLAQFTSSLSASDFDAATYQGRKMGSIQCLQSFSLVNNFALKSTVSIRSPIAHKKRRKNVERQMIQETVAENACDSVKILKVENSITGTGSNGESSRPVLDGVEHTKESISPITANLSTVPIIILCEDAPLAEETEPNDSEMDIENSIIQEPFMDESHGDVVGLEETARSSESFVSVERRILGNVETSHKVITATQKSPLKEDSSPEISEKPAETVVSPDVQSPGELLSDSICSSHKSFDSPKILDSSDPSALESELDEPRADKLNTQEEAFPPLRDCTDPLSLVIDRLTTKVWKERCKHSLEKKNIFTIGDLSKLTEDVVDRIPFKANKWKNLTAELKAYHSRISRSKQSHEMSPETTHAQCSDAVANEVVGSNMQNFREILQKMSAKDIWKELCALNLTDAVLQEVNDENNSFISSSTPSDKILSTSERLSETAVSPKTFESTSVQVSEFEVLSELELIAKKPLIVQSCSQSVQVSEGDLMLGIPGKNEPVAQKTSKSLSAKVTESELETLSGKPAQGPIMPVSIAVQVSTGDIFSRMDSSEVLQSMFGRSDFSNALGKLPEDKLLELIKSATRIMQEQFQLHDGSVDMTARKVVQCVMRELMKEGGPVDTVKTLMWTFQNTLFSKEHVKAIPSVLSGINENVVAELILNEENIMNSIESKMSAAKGLKMAVNILEQRSISLLPEEDIDRLNDILDNYRTCVELFDRYTRVVKERIMGSNASR